jgi:hypothetical protein
MTSLPRVEWAFFCGSAEAIGQCVTTAATRIRHTVPRFRGDLVGIAMLLVFGVAGVPNTVAPLRLTVVSPGGRHLTREVLVDTGETGLAEIRANIAPLRIDDVGELRAEFRFGGDAEASHIATLEVVDNRVTVAPERPPGSSRVH